MVDKTGIESLIADLGQDLKPVKPMRHPLVHMLPILVLVPLYVLVAAYVMGLRGDAQNFLRDNQIFRLEAFFALAAYMSAIFAVGWLSVPDMRGQKWIVFLPWAFLAGFVCVMIYRAVTENGDIPHLDHFWSRCLIDACIFGFIPAAGIAWWVRKGGAPTHIGLLATTVMLCVSSLGWVGLRFTCSVDNVGHSYFVHFMPFVISGIVFITLAKRIFRW